MWICMDSLFCLAPDHLWCLFIVFSPSKDEAITEFLTDFIHKLLLLNPFHVSSKNHTVITSYLLLIKWACCYCHIQISAAEFNNTELRMKQLVLDISNVNKDRQTHLNWRGQPRQRKQTKLII